MKLHHIILITFIFLFASCSFLTPEFTDEDLKLIQWAEKGSYITFVSDKYDTVNYLITDIVYKKHEPGSGINSSYYTISLTVHYSNGIMAAISKKNGTPYLYIYLSGVDELAYTGIKNSNGETYFDTDTTINNITYKNIRVIDNPHGDTKITKLIWSKYHGPLEYHTNDGKVWIRQNVLSDTSYTPVVFDNTAKPKQKQQSSGSFFNQEPALIIGLVVLAIVVVYAVVALFVLNRR